MSQFQLNLPPVPVTSGSHAREMVAPPTGTDISLTRWLAESVSGTGLSEKDAALTQGYAPNYWSRIKSGEKAAQLEPILKLPERAQRVFLARWAEHIGLHVTDADEQKVAVIGLLEAATRFIRATA